MDALMRPCIQLVCQGYRKKLDAELEHHLRKEGALQQDTCFFFGSFPNENSLALAEIAPNQEIAEDIYFLSQYFIC